MHRTFARYARVYHHVSGTYLHIIAPGPTVDTVLVGDDHRAFPVSRANVRTLRWYERLLNL